MGEVHAYGLVENASVVTDLWGTAQGIMLNLSVLGYFKSFERYTHTHIQLSINN